MVSNDQEVGHKCKTQSFVQAKKKGQEAQRRSKGHLISKGHFWCQKINVGTYSIILTKDYLKLRFCEKDTIFFAKSPP